VWDGTPNPRGYTAGQSVTSTLPQVVWFCGHEGPIPMDQEFVVKESLESRFRAAMDRFGPGGSLRDEWGGTPQEK
jgi:hypothetical protein